MITTILNSSDSITVPQSLFLFPGDLDPRGLRTACSCLQVTVPLALGSSDPITVPQGPPDLPVPRRGAGGGRSPQFPNAPARNLLWELQCTQGLSWNHRNLAKARSTALLHPSPNLRTQIECQKG